MDNVCAGQIICQLDRAAQSAVSGAVIADRWKPIVIAGVAGAVDDYWELWNLRAPEIGKAGEEESCSCNGRIKENESSVHGGVISQRKPR